MVPSVGDREAVGQSRRVFPDEVGEIVEQLLAGDVAVGVERVGHDDGLGGLGLRHVEHALIGRQRDAVGAVQLLLDGA